MGKEVYKSFEAVDELYGEYLEFIKELCNMSSKTEDKPDVDSVLDAVLEHEKDNGYMVVRKPMKKAGDVASITYFCGDSLPTVCLSAHMDTVFPKGTFSEPMVTEDEEKLYGPGVCDCKGNIALGFLVMASLRRIGFKGANIKIILQSDEEVSSSLSEKETIRFMCDEARGSSAFLNLETGVGNALTTGRYGVIKYRFDITGKGAHAAQKMKGEGISAIKEAAYKILEIENLDTRDNLSFVVGLVNGGTASNTVAEKCSFTVDCRVKNISDIDEAQRRMRNIADKAFVNSTACVLTEEGMHYPFAENEKTEELFKIINNANKKYLGGELTKRVTGGGADVTYPSMEGIPSIDGMGLEGGNLHSTDEYMIKSSLSSRAKRIIAAICELSLTKA